MTTLTPALIDGTPMSSDALLAALEDLQMPHRTVDPFAVANDVGGVVRLVIDADVLAGPDIWVHPLVNTRTTGLSPDGLLRYLRSVDHEPTIMQFE